MARPTSNLRRFTAALLLFLATGLARADDLDIYTDPTPLPQQAPLTALALDLNLGNPNTVLCSNVLTSTEANCLEIRGKITLGELLTLLGLPATIAGPLNPQTLLADLSSSVLAALSTPISAGGSLSLTEQQLYVLGIQQILESLANSRVTIILNHDDRGARIGNTSTFAPCAFADLSSIPGQRQDTTGCSNGAYLFAGLTNLADPLQLAALITRVTTALVGDPVTVTSSGNNNSATVTVPTVPRAFAAKHPYQAKEIYLELAKYLRGDPIYNGHLGVYDYGDDNAANNLNNSFPLLSWDTSAEQTGNRTYKSGLEQFPLACNVNLIHVQATAAARQDDSDAALQALFPDADSDRNGTLTLPELVLSAEKTGFVFGTDDRRRIRSRFVVQDNLFGGGNVNDLNRIGALGGNVTTYTNVLGLLGRGQSIAGSLVDPLSIDTSLSSLTLAASRSTATGRLNSVYLPAFRADPNQKPAWPGNLKRLSLRAKAAPNQNEFDVVDARDTGSGTVTPATDASGRIRDNALTIWTDATQLGAGRSSDGPIADLGGAGQRIPGYALNGGGNPGRGNSATGARQIYYDSMRGANGTLCGDLTGSDPVDCGKLNPDDSGVRTELLAATGATAYTSPFSICSTNCNATAGACGLLCSTNQTACGAGCTTQSTACNALCLPGTLGNSCRASCTTNLNTCNTNCANTAATCNTSCTSTLNSCLVSCGPGASSRTADTVNRELLLYARGFEVGTKAAPPASATGPADSPTNSGIGSRRWMMGAVLHSRPLAINYGRRNGAANPEDVRVVFGSADGMLRMVNDTTGVENWGFMPQAVMGSLSTLRENQSGATLPYGVDGSPLVLIRDRSTADIASASDGIINTATSSVHDRVLLFFGLRRGGAAYYALDITNPDAPKLVWRLNAAGLMRAGQATVDAGSAAQFAALGLAFSTPQVARIRLDADGVAATTNDVSLRTVLIFGGGYNGGRNAAGVRIGKDFNNSRNAVSTLRTGTNDTTLADRGNALYMIDAETGQLVWRAVRNTTAGVASYTATGTPLTRSYNHPMLEDSIASDVTVLDTDNDGITDRLYVGDTGGRLWRADFPGVYAANWTITPIASVGRHNAGNDNLVNDRRIFFAPDFVPIRNDTNRNGVDLVLFGTGDREDPLNLTTQNWFYALRDTDVVSGKAASEIVLAEDNASLPKHGSFDDVTTASTFQDVSSLTTGYAFRLTRSGEKHFSSPITLNGQTVFTTYVPPDPSVPTARICAPSEGVSRLYSIGSRTSKFFSRTTTSSGRDVPLGTGLAPQINTLSDNSVAVGGKTESIGGANTYRASWRERLGETQK